MLQKMEKYIRNLLFLNLQLKDIKQNMTRKERTKLRFILVNKDIIDVYLNNEINTDINIFIDQYKNNNNINDYNELYENKHFDFLLNYFINNYKDKHIKIKKLNSSFLVPEKLTKNGIEYPYNFFLLRESVFNNLFDINQSNIMDFPYI